MGLRAHTNGDLDSAKIFYEKVLNVDPNCVLALGWLGTIEAQRKNFSIAQPLLEKALAGSNDPNFLLNYATLLQENYHYEEAIEIYLKVINVRRSQVALSNLAACHNKLKQSDKSLYISDEALLIDPNYAEAWSNRGNALNDLKRHEEALASYERSLELKPDYAEAWSNRGVALNDLKRHEEALASYERSIKLKPDNAKAWSNRGNTLNDLKRHEEALASYERSLELKPDYAEAWSDRGVALNALKRHEEALASYERSTEFKPDYAEALYNKGLLQLAQRDFLSGFENYRWRWKVKDFFSPQIRTTLPACSSKCSPKNILLWAEQGLGDEIFYAGMLNQALDKYSSVSLIADARLHPVFARSFPQIKLLNRGSSKSESFDVGFESQAPIGDLGSILTLSGEEIAASRKPFLIADPDKKAAFRLSEPFGRKKIVCGIAWSSANKDFGNEKSIDLLQLEPILENPELEFINLQYGQVHTEIQKAKDRFGVTIHQAKNLDIYHNIDGLLALIDACDIVITTSNVTAHLAGSIGKKGCVLVPISKGKIWYWHLNDVSSFWYPSLRVFYQIDRDGWSNTISQLQKWLEEDLEWNR